MRPIRLNFLAFEQQEFGLEVYRRQAQSGVFSDEYQYYDLPNDAGNKLKYEISTIPKEGFESYVLPSFYNTSIVGSRLFDKLEEASMSITARFEHKQDTALKRRLHFEMETHPKGKKTIWIEPYFLKTKSLWGVLIGFRFIVNENLILDGKAQLDRDILIASGSLNSRGQSNLDYYLFKHEQIGKFIKQILPQINQNLRVKLKPELEEIPSFQLKPKEYIFKDGQSNSPYLGLTRYEPLTSVDPNQVYEFIYKSEDRNYAVALLRGLRGDTHPNTFTGMEKMFKVSFTNDKIKGTQIESLSETVIGDKIAEIKASSVNVLPIIITNTKDSSEDKQYYFLKNKFTNAGISCQVVTKDLIQNENSLKYSLGNIGLQIFAKSGGKPWRMKPATNEYLIIGIGQSYNIEHTGHGNTIEKNITYSILTDSSGVFKDIQVLSEGIESDSTYWQKLVTSIVEIINKSGSKRVVIHIPFRISKEKVLEKVSEQIGAEIEFSVLVINSKSDLWGFDYSNNGLVPFESTFLKLSKYEYLVWFEGLQYSNPKITKRFGNPLKISFWYSNKPQLLQDYSHKESLLQDCINLSGANWRGFKTKQLPVSIFYCQRIAEFIAKFREYHLEHIEINNLKPWFL